MAVQENPPLAALKSKKGRRASIFTSAELARTSSMGQAQLITAQGVQRQGRQAAAMHAGREAPRASGCTEASENPAVSL